MSAQAFSPAEAAALVDLPEGRVRKEIEHGFFEKRGRGRRPSLGFEALVFLRAVQLMELELRVDDRKKVLKSIRNALVHSRPPETVELSSVLRLALGPIVRELTEKVAAFDAWKKKLVIRDDILGGEPVFPGSRLAVRHVGGLMERGESSEAIIEDYPYLDEQDLKFAALFSRAYARVGRPRATDQAAPR
jgi:uncharacterized protein (DUF433 family)